MRLTGWLLQNTALSKKSPPSKAWVSANCKFAEIDPNAKKLPKRIVAPGLEGYVIVDQGRSGRNPDGSWSVSGTQYTDQQATPLFNHRARANEIATYDGPHSPVYLEEKRLAEEQKATAEDARKQEEERQLQQQTQQERDQYLSEQGVRPRSLKGEWEIKDVPDLNLDALGDPRTKQQTLRVLKERTGRDFSDEELGQIAALHVYDNDRVKIKDVDPQTGMAEIYSPILGEEDSETVSMNVLQGFGSPHMPQAALSQQRKRHNRALKPYANIPEFQATGELDRLMMGKMTPNLQRYIPNVKMSGDVYENFGLQRYGDPLGEQLFLDELKVFGLDPDVFPEGTMRVNTARAQVGDEPLRGAWSGYVTLLPDESGRVPQQVLEEAMGIASDSRPQIEAGDRYMPVDRDEFWEAYRRGPVHFSSNNLFRHLTGLGYFGNSWYEARQPS